MSELEMTPRDRAEAQSAYNQKLRAEMSNEWIDVSDRLPAPKPDWNHSKKCVVFYPPQEGEGKVWTYGIAYYHYKPPFDVPCWVNYSEPRQRQPTHWKPLEPPK